MSRDNFSEKVKVTLRTRVAGRCSNPNCRKITIGPNKLPDKVTILGEAAHICAAAEGGPRYDPNMTSDKRKSIDNGIWLCNTCARMIDANERHYTVELLHKWKDQAEKSSYQDLTKRLIPREPINPHRKNDIDCLKLFIEYGDLFYLKRDIRDLPKIVYFDFFKFRNVLDEIEYYPEIWPVRDPILDRLLKNLIISFKKLEDYIHGYSEYNGQIYHNFGPLAERINKIFRLREGLPLKIENRIDSALIDEGEKFSFEYDNLIEYMRKEYPELF